LTAPINPADVFKPEHKSFDLILKDYQTKCDSVFKDLNSDKEFPRELETGGVFKFNKFSLDMSS
jgi:hypothetical protein